MKKTAISLALVLAMLVTTLLVAVPASAVNATHKAHCACNGKAVDVGSHEACTVPETWTALTDANWATIVDGGNFYLTDNITADAANAMLTIPNEVELTICLNGNTITTGNNKLFLVAGTLNITDCQGSGVINSGHVQTSGTGARGSIFNSQASTGEINIFSGTYNANTTTGQKGSGAVAYIKKGTLNIYNGTMNGTSASMGGVLNVTGESGAVGKINMYGGIVQGGKSDDRGGNVFINSFGVMNMYGGTVSGGKCTATADNKGGGNIFVSGTYTGNKAGKLNVYGGSIVDGDASKGSNIYVHYYGEAHLYGGAVMGGSASANSIETGVSSSGTVGIANLYGGSVQLIQDTNITADATKFTVNTENNAYGSLVIDLNGKTLSGDKSSITGKIGLADSNIKEAAGQSVIANVDIADFGLADIEQGAYSPVGRYITLKDDNGDLVIHRIYVGFNKIQLTKDGDNVGMNYVTNFVMDDEIKDLLVNDANNNNYAVYCKFGVGSVSSEALGFAKDAFKANISTDIDAILGGQTDPEVAAATKICAQTFVNLEIDGQTVTIESNIYEYSLQDVVDALEGLNNKGELTTQNPAAATLLADIKTLYPSLFN